MVENFHQIYQDENLIKFLRFSLQIDEKKVPSLKWFADYFLNSDEQIDKKYKGKDDFIFNEFEASLNEDIDSKEDKMYK